MRLQWSGRVGAPVNPDTLDLLKAYVVFETPVEGVLSWRWRTFDENLRELEGFDIPTNFVPMVGHGTVRIDAMGFENRPPTADDLARMKANPSIGQYGSFPRVLGYYVREKKLLRLEEAVRKMTSYAAQTMGLRRKGLLREGADADITVFDLDSISASLDGNKCYPKGIEHVVLAGRSVVDGASYHGDMAGRVIRRGEAAVGRGPSPA